MEYENFEKVEELVKQVKEQEELLDTLGGSPKVTIERQYRSDEIVLDLSRGIIPIEFKEYAETFVFSMKANILAKILDIKEELRKL